MKPVYCSIIIAILFSCTKTETKIITIKKPTASFEVRVNNPTFPYHPNVGYIDSFFSFINTSDTASDITYKWDFGDGNASDEINPKHQYHKRGIYRITLTVNKNDQYIDTSSQTVKVILGQQAISLGKDKSVFPFDVIETADHGFIIAGSYYNSVTYSNDEWFFLKTDSLLHQTDLIIFPNSVRFSSAKKTNDGNYILCGTTTGSNRYNELIKVDAGGNIIWNKVFPANFYIRDAEQCADNSYAFVASTPTTLQGYYEVNVIGKVDGSGNELWTKTLDSDIIMTTAANLSIDNNDMVLAGVKRYKDGSQSYYCEYCDSVIIAKYSLNGQLVWNNRILWGLNTNNYFDTRIAKHPDDTYSVINQQINGLYLFDHLGNFTDRKLLEGQRLAYNTTTSDDNILILETEYSNGFHMHISKFSTAGAAFWQTGVDGTQYLDPNTEICCSDTQGTTATSLSVGGNLVIGTRFDYVSSDLLKKQQNILLVELDEDGSVK